MTNIQAILKADECKRNTIDAEVKCAWLTEVDQTIYHHILATHEGELPAFPQYALNEEKELLKYYVARTITLAALSSGSSNRLAA